MSRILFPFLLITLLVSQTAWAPQTDMVSEILNETNAFRKSNRLPPLELNADLNRLAETHSTNMAKGRVGFGHGGFNNRDAEARRKISGLRRFAENVAQGAQTGRDAVTLWKNSSGHRRNMLGNYKYIGIGTARDRKGRIYFTQVFAG